MASISEGKRYLRLRESKIGEHNEELLQPDGESKGNVPLGLGASIGGKEGFTNFMGPSAVDPVNKREREQVVELEDDFNRSLSKFASRQAQLMEDTKRFVEVTAPGQNRYARKIVRFRNGWIGYVSRYGEVRLLPVPPGPGGTINNDGLANSFLTGMKKRPGCDDYAYQIPSDFPADSMENLPALGSPIKVDGMRIDLFYGGVLPNTDTQNQFGMPCGMEGDNVQVTMMADTQKMWAATEQGKRVGEKTVAAGLAARPEYDWPAAGKYAPPGDQAFIGCVRNSRETRGAGSSLQKQDDLGKVNRFDCFTRAVDLGAQAYGLSEAKADGPEVKGTCYVGYKDEVNVVSDLQRRFTNVNCSLWRDKSSYRFATRTMSAIVEPTVVVVTAKEASQGLQYGISPWGRLIGVYGGALAKAVADAATAKDKYWEKKWDIDRDINEREGKAAIPVEEEQRKLEERTNAYNAAKSARAASMAQAQQLLNQAAGTTDSQQRLLLLGQGVEASKEAERVGKDVTKYGKAMEKEEEALSKASIKEVRIDQSLEESRARQQEKNSLDLMNTMLKIKQTLYKSTKISAPAFGETPTDKCEMTSKYVGKCYGGVVLTLDDGGTLTLGKEEDYFENGEIKDPIWNWSSGQLMGVPLPDLPACSRFVGVIEPSAADAAPILDTNTTLSSPTGNCRIVMKVEPVMIDGKVHVGPRKDASGKWLPAGEVTKQIPDPFGSVKMYLELQWFLSECAGLHDKDDVQGMDPHEYGQAGGKTSDAVALHQVPGLPPAPWKSSGTAQNAYYVPGTVSGACNSGFITEPRKLTYMSGESVGMGTTYAEIVGYDTQGNDIPGESIIDVSLNECKARCNANSKCGGFVYRESGGLCYPKTTDMFPKGLRKRAAGANIYLRHIKPKFESGNVCPKGVESSTVYQMQSFETTGEVSPDMQCDLAAAAGCDMIPIEKAAKELRGKQKNMLNHIQDLGKKDSRLVAELGYNVDRLKNDIAAYGETVDRSGELSGGGMVGPQAHQEDTDLLMVQENYRYLLWTIGAVITVGVGLKLARN